MSNTSLEGGGYYPANYQPVTLTSLKHTTANQIMLYIETNSLLTDINMNLGPEDHSNPNPELHIGAS